ncbi:MAG TPA: HNH endonuclease family protein [Candidatus Saccharimonadales bacterium]|jgi:hypothetical protein
MVFGKLSGRAWRVTIVAAIALLVVGGAVLSNSHEPNAPANTAILSSNETLAIKALGKLAVKSTASHAGYARRKFADGWTTVGNCDMREQVLNRDLANVKDQSASDCTVLSGTLHDPYSGKTIAFKRGAGTSSLVQIDHVVAISDAWATGAQNLSATQREKLYNDPLELLAVDGQANDAKSDADAAAWLPPNKPYDCRYVARQIAVKLKYHLWVTNPEHAAMQHVLQTCPSQILPLTSSQK